MTVLVTGAAGFLGSHLTERLLGEGHNVIAIDNLLTGQWDNLRHLEHEPGFHFIEADVSAGIPLGETSLEWVLHLASPASPPDYLRYPIETLRVGAMGTYNALELARTAGARFLLASTSEVYGDPLVHPQPEAYRGHVNSVGPRSCYDEAKRYAEALTAAYARRYGMDVRIVRIFNTYGPRMRLDDGRVVSNFVYQALQGEPLTVYGDGTQTRSFCYVEDLIQGIRRVMQLGRSGQFLGTGVSLASSEAGDELPGVGKPLVVNLGNPEEYRVIDLARLVLELTGSQSFLEFRPLPQDDPQQRCPDISLAQRLLGWEPRVPVREGLVRTIAWFRHLVSAGGEGIAEVKAAG